MPGSSELRVTTMPAARSRLNGWCRSEATAPVATFDVGQTSSGIRMSARCDSRAGSPTALMPCPIRSGVSESSVSQMFCGPAHSPAWGTECRPAATAAPTRSA
jgi:hypothetical protein